MSLIYLYVFMFMHMDMDFHFCSCLGPMDVKSRQLAEREADERGCSEMLNISTRYAK